MRPFCCVRRHYLSAMASLLLVVVASVLAFPHAGKATARFRSALSRLRPEPVGHPSPMFVTITVTTTDDTVAADGVCSLREAMTASNTKTQVNECVTGSGLDTITFNIPGAGVHTITLTSPLPAIDDSHMTIDGTTQPGFTGTPLIELNGNGNTGLSLIGRSSEIRGLILNRFSGDAISLTNDGSNVIAGNYIGTDATGITASANTGNGISIVGPPRNTIGGATAADRNVISGNTGNGIVIQTADSSGNDIQGNYIGVNVSGTAALPNAQAGISISSAPNNTIGGNDAGERNIISGNTGNGIEFLSGNADGNLVIGNYIGTDATGLIGLGNGANGVAIVGDNQDNTIGGNNPARRNIISGNGGNGIAMISVVSLLIRTAPNMIIGNFVGTNVAGTAALGNTLNGIISDNMPIAEIGDGRAGDGNVISGNLQNGIRIINAGATGTTVLGNFIGTDPTGTAPLGNGGSGVSIADVPTTVTGDARAGNVIAANGHNGVTVTGSTAIGNTISSNSIFANTGLGIDLGDDGVTPNDAGDSDSGPNDLQNFPVITDGTPEIISTINSKIGSTFRLEYFSSTAPDPSGFGEGQTLLGVATATTDGTGNASFFFSSPQIGPGQNITITATGPDGSTSEFSRVFLATEPTSVEFCEAKSFYSPAGVTLQWQGGLETQNLGYDVYRDNGRDDPRDKSGQRTLITPEPIAGSALVTNDTATDNHSYTWVDQNAPPGARYWVEDIDLSGKRTLHGPFTPGETSKISLKRSRLLTELNSSERGRLIRQSGSPVLPDTATNSPAIAGETDNIIGPQTRAVVSTKKLVPPRFVNPKTSSASLESQSAVKIYVNHDGWYRVTADQLAAAGLDGTVAPGRLQLFTGGTQVPIQVNADLSVEFYGQGLDTPTTDKQIYWLVVGKGQGLRISQVQSGQATNTPQTDFTYAVEQRYRTTYFSSLLNGDDGNIFGPVISSSVVSETMDVQDPTNANSAATLEIALQGVTDGPHAVNVKLNGTDIGSVNFGSRDHAVANLAIPTGALLDGNNTVSISRKGGATNLSLLDYLRVTYQRQYRAIDNSLSFSVDAGQSARLTGFTTENVRLFDITNPQAVTQVAVTPQADSTGFALSVASSSSARTMLALPGDAADQPVSVVANNKSNWRAKGHAADLLVISHKDFLSAIDPLVQARRAQGLKVEVADVEDVFDEFSFGQHTPLAIRDFLSWAKGHWPTAPRFVMLVGDSTWDPRNYLGKGDADLVPTKLIDTSQLETASDDWLADFNDDGLPEMAIGRLPVRTVDQATAVVSKILAYGASGPNANGALLVSDTKFEARSADVRTLLPVGMPVQLLNRSDGPNDAAVHAGILAALNKQPLLVNYIGHGSVDEWTGARLLTGDDAGALTNSSHLPVMVMMTCLNGYSHDVFINSLGKAMFLQPNTGAVAVWSSSGITTPDSQQQMARQLYSKLFGGQNLRLGEAILAAKAATLNHDVRRTWMLLGDPTMVLASH